MSQAQALPETRSAAKAAGFRGYFTGKPCKQGHISDRQTLDGKCRACSNARRMARYWSKHEEELASRKTARQKNPEKVSLRNRRYRAANKDGLRSRRAVAYKTNAELHRHRKREDYRNRLEQVSALKKAWCKANPDKIRARNRNVRARKRAAEGKHSAADVAEILKAQKHRCAYCRISLRSKKRHVDHIVPIIKGGRNDRKNLQVLCAHCNLKKHARDPLDFSRSLGMLL